MPASSTLPCVMNDLVYETGSTATVRAFHVMPGMPPPGGERHAHDYRFDVVVSRDDVDDRGMVVDLDRLEHALNAIADAIEDVDLDAVVAPQMRTEAVTVEIFARWVHDRLAQSLGPLPSATMSVRVWESPEAFGGYAAPLSG
jgi:6-pyruvoyltetrahydropterin/6-carboxytetrahydropterin synthase